MDRAVATTNWMKIFGSLGVEVITSCVFDHQPTLFSVCKGLQVKPRTNHIFKFDAIWMEQKEIRQLRRFGTCTCRHKTVGSKCSQSYNDAVRLY